MSVFPNPLTGSIKKAEGCIFYVLTHLIAARIQIESWIKCVPIYIFLDITQYLNALWCLFAVGVKHICWSDHLCLGYLHHWTIIAIIANITRTPKNSHPADILKTQLNWHLRFICFAFICLSSGCHFKQIWNTNWPGMFGTQFEWNCDKWIIFLSWGVVMY